MKFLYTKEKAEDLKKQLEMSGAGGKDGDTPFINSAGNWQIGDIDTGNKAQGPQGVQGKTGPQGVQGKAGVKGDSGTNIINQNTGIDTKIWIGTQSEYDAVVTKDSDTLYMVK